MTLTADRLRSLIDAPVPDGYLLRGYMPGDEQGWVELLLRCGFSEWDRSAIDGYLADAERRRGSRVVAKGKEIVAGTFAS